MQLAHLPHILWRNLMRNNDPKSENKALRERAAKTKDVEARLKTTAREHQRPAGKASGRPKADKPARS
jgi:hypothetical protein